MDESEGNMSSEEVRSADSSSAVKKPKKRSLVERELETNLTARITSPATDGLSTSRYGRARRLKTDYEITKEKAFKTETTPVKSKSPAYKMHASNSLCKKETNESYLENQIDNIYQENISLSRFSNESSPSPAKKFPKVYTRKDLIQNREAEETIMLISNLFSPTRSSKTPRINADFCTFESSEKKVKQNGHIDNASVVKTLDFDGKKKPQNQSNEQKTPAVSKNDLLETEIKCPYQVGDLAWARMGTFPFWPSIVTREPSTELFIKKKMFGRVERDIIHVTFLGDNGRRSWVVDNMLQKYVGLKDFEETRNKFTAEDKKKDPKLYAAYFVSEKKRSLWNNSVEEAETLLKEPKRLRIDVFNDMLWKAQASKKTKSGKICRTDSDVSLSESLYDSLFSEDDKSDDPEKSKSKMRKSFDVSEVVTACLDNMAAKTGITKIQRQSHMDRWLQKAKSKTPEKISKLQPKAEKSTKSKKKSPKSHNSLRSRKSNDSLPSKSTSSEDDSKNDRSKRLRRSKIEISDEETKINDCRKVIAVDNSHSVENKDDHKENKVSEAEINKKVEDDEINSKVINIEVSATESDSDAKGDKKSDDSLINDVVSSIDKQEESSKELNNTTEDPDSSKSYKSPSNEDTQNRSGNSLQSYEKTEIDINKSILEFEKPEENIANDEIFKADSENVSNESLEAIVKLPNICETSMKVEKENGMKDITNEASVTETTNTINIEADDTQERPKQDIKQKKLNMDSLEVNDDTEIADNFLEYDPKIIPTTDHENYNEIEHFNIEQRELIKDRNFNQQGLISSNLSNDNSKKKSCDTNVSSKDSDKLIENDSSLNKSDNSESILLFDNHENDTANTSMHSDSSISTLENQMAIKGTILENSQTSTDDQDKPLETRKMSMDETDTEIAMLTKTAHNDNEQKQDRITYVESPTFTQDLDYSITGTKNDTEKDTYDESKNKDLKDRSEVESPTFTQLLESEEFFRDVDNGICKNKSQNLPKDAVDNLINGPECNKHTDKLQSNKEDKGDKTCEVVDLKSMNREDVYKNKKTLNSTLKTDKCFDGHDTKSIDNDNINKETSPCKIEHKNLHNDKLIYNQIDVQLLHSETETHINNKCNTPEKALPVIVKEHENDDNLSHNKIDKLDESDDDEDSDEPSPEYESLDEDITEDFRKHMLSIENNLKDKKDVEHIEKICNEIAEKAKLSPTKYVDLTCENDLQRKEIKKEEISKVIENECEIVYKDLAENEEFRSKCIKNLSMNEANENPTKLNGNATEIEVSKAGIMTRSRLQLSTEIKRSSDKDVREPKVLISPLKFNTNLIITNKSIMEGRKSKKLRLSLNKSPKAERLQTVEKQPNLDKKQKDLQPVIGQLINSNVQEPVMNGYHEVNKKCNIEKDIDTKLTNGIDTDTGSKLNDTDKDLNKDTVSINSEDSDDSVEEIPRRNLRSRTATTLEYALKSPEFLKYLELRQDYLMDEHPELNDKEILSYVFKTWEYERTDYKTEDSYLVKGIRQETPRKKSKKEPRHKIGKYFDCDKSCKTVKSEAVETTKLVNEIKQEPELIVRSQDKTEAMVSNNVDVKESKVDTTNIEITSDSVVKSNEGDKDESLSKTKRKAKSDGKVKSKSTSNEHSPRVNAECRSDSPTLIDNDVILVKDKYKDLDTVSVKSEESSRKSLRSRTSTPRIIDMRTEKLVKEEDNDSIDSDNSEINLRQLRSKVLKEKVQENKQATESAEILNTSVKEEADDAGSTISDNEPLLRRKKKIDKTAAKSLEDPEFIKYLELKQDALMDENPQLTESEIVNYLHKTWLYEESTKSDIKKSDEIEQANLIKGCNESVEHKKPKRKPKSEKNTDDPGRKIKDEKNSDETASRDKPRRKTIQPLYNEEFYSDMEEELEVYEIFKTKKTTLITGASKTDKDKSPKASTKNDKDVEIVEHKSETEYETQNGNEQAILDEIELYFTELAKPKPSVFKGLIRERVCDICEREGSLVKCKSCFGMYHIDCVKKQQQEIIEIESLPLRGRKKKRKLGRKPKSLDSEHSDEKSQDASMDSVEEIVAPEIAFDADTFESQLEDKMRKMLENAETNYESYSSDEGIDWNGTVAGKCEIVDVKLKPRTPTIDFSDFKCNDCLKHEVPVCFVCRSAVSKTEKKMRQKCVAPQCNKYYHLECLDHWPQTQFNSGESSRNKKVNQITETLTCPRHVCHTCVSDDPRGCKTRFSADKLAKCVRCPATYHAFNKCLPAGTQVLTASQIICPRHYEQKAGKVSCHVNTGWCFICAEGGSLICCEYCPTSFHAECLNIKPPEGNYMCEDCETGRLPLYGEMVWVKLGHYRWWPGIILHPSEIPENLFLMKHGIGEFVVRFFGQYDHYWVNRGRVFPYQEGDSGRISSQKSKIDAAFTTAIEHAQRAYEILKNADTSNDEESQDIASSLLPPHYVKLKSNKPCGSLCGRRIEDPSLSLTACECSPTEKDPCGPYSHCLNRMLLTECGPTCKTGDRCNNRAFEKRLYPKLVPYRTPHRGWGLKTLENIKAGQFVIEYVGELIDEEEFRRRMRRKHEIRDENYYFLTLDKERMIDAGPKGNLARFMNHCCEPNCETQKWTVLGDIRVGLFAIDDIPANTEVTFNYKLECDGIEKKRCLCGAKRCSGYIGAKPKQDESQSKKVKTAKIKRPYNKKKKAEDSPSTKGKQKRPLGRPAKPKELTEIEKDLLIINSASNGISSEESKKSVDEKSLKRKRSTEEVVSEPSAKKVKCEVGD